MALANLLLSTDYPIDKIVGVQTGSGVVGTGPLFDSLEPHGLGFTPLLLAKWSLTSDFAVSYDAASLLTPYSAGVTFRTNGTNLHIRAANYTAAALTIYWRVIYFMPANVDVVAAPTQATTGMFTLNTDYNYTKLISSGVSEGATGSVAHLLGYYPQNEVWWELDGWMNKANFAQLPTPDDPSASVTTSLLHFTAGSVISPNRWHYRIYAEAL